MRSLILLAFLATAATPAAPVLSRADQAAAFRAANFTRVAGKWQGCDDPGTMSYTPGAIEQIGDFNGDGRPDVVITEGSTYCFGMTGTGYSLVSKQVNGSWRVITSGGGILHFLPRAAASGWPDIEIGGPGFCFPVQRWNGREYALNRHQYEGKRCRPQG